MSRKCFYLRLCYSQGKPQAWAPPSMEWRYARLHAKPQDCGCSPGNHFCFRTKAVLSSGPTLPRCESQLCHFLVV